MHQLKNLTPNCELQLTKYKKKTTEINATEHTNLMDDYPELETTITNLKKEQNSDRVIKKLSKWLETNSTPSANIYSTEEQVSQTVSTTIYRKRNTLQNIFCPRWNIIVQTIMCTENNNERIYVQNTQLSKWKTLGNYANN